MRYEELNLLAPAKFLSYKSFVEAWTMPTEYEKRAAMYLEHFNKTGRFESFINYQFWWIAATFGIEQARKEL